MPGFLAQVSAQVTCTHQGQAKPLPPNPRVLVSGEPTVLLTAQYTVAGCAFPPPPNGNGPCVTGKFMSGTLRVLSMGQPLVIVGSQGTCVPTGTPLLVVLTQPRVVAS